MSRSLCRVWLPIALIMLFAAAPIAPALRSAAPVYAQNGTPGTVIPLPVAVAGEHPRLLITRPYVQDTLQPRAAAHATTWTAFEEYVTGEGPEEDAEWTPGTALRSLALAWLITNDGTYAARAKAVLGGLAARVANHPVMSGADGFDGEFMGDVSALAVGYDWLYGALTASDRATLRDTLWQASAALRDPANDTDGVIWVDGQLMAFGNYEPRWLWALTAVGLALDGDYEGTAGLIAYCRKTFTGTFIPALDLQEGGAWAEGPVYGFIANWPKAQTALAWWTALGENTFDDTGWWYDRLAYDMFLYHPGQTTTYNADWGDPMHSYPSIIGDSERYHGAVYYGRAQDELLRAVFAGTAHAAWMDWFLSQPPDFMPGWMAVEEFLWRDPAAQGTPPPVTTWFAPYNGHVFLRSNWTTEANTLDQSATYVSFNAGDRLTYHQFYDEGSLTIYHNGEELLVHSGVYSGDGTSEHDANYYVRTIAANSLLICDLAEDFDGIRPNNERDVWLNDCGQRTMQPASRTAINVANLIAHWQSYDTGTITRFGESGGMTYLRADITGAYNSTVYTTPENRAKVSAVIREFVYMRPDVVILSDRIVTTYPNFTPMAVFHFQTEPTPSGLFYGSLVRDSALYMQNFLPNSTVTMVAGYLVAGQEINTSWGEPVGNTFETDPYGYFRLEITPAALGLENWFLTAFIAQDADQAPPVPGAMVPGDGVRGVVLGTAQVMFDSVPEDGEDLTLASFQVGIGVTQVLVTGLTPNADYTVQGDAGFTRTQTADDAGLIVVEGAPAGTLRVSVAES